MSRAVLARVLRILQALVVEAERRGYRVERAPALESRRHGRTRWTGANQGHLVISVGEYSEAVRVTEEGLQSRAHWEKQNRSVSWWGGEMWVSRPPRKDYEAGATGRLKLELVPGYRSGGRAGQWADRSSEHVAYAISLARRSDVAPTSAPLQSREHHYNAIAQPFLTPLAEREPELRLAARGRLSLRNRDHLARLLQRRLARRVARTTSRQRETPRSAGLSLIRPYRAADDAAALEFFVSALARELASIRQAVGA